MRPRRPRYRPGAPCLATNRRPGGADVGWSASGPPPTWVGRPRARCTGLWRPPRWPAAGPRPGHDWPSPSGPTHGPGHRSRVRSWSMSTDDLGTRVAELRAKGLTPKQIAKVLGVAPSVVAPLVRAAAQAQAARAADAEPP